MTRVGSNGEGPGFQPSPQDAGQRPAQTRQDGDLSGQGRSTRRDPGSSAGLQRGGTGRFDEGHGAEMDERHEAFAQRLREAMAGLPTEPRQSGGEGETTRRLLAVAEAAAQALPIGGLAPMLEALPTPRAPGDAAARVEAISARIEAALAAELRSGGRGPLSLTIPLGMDEFGLDAVTVTLAGDVIEVTLSRTGAPAADLAGAQSLADRLQQRFSRRSVRVLEAGPALRAPHAADGLGEIGALFGARSTS